MYVVIADFNPSETDTDGLRLIEGQFVEVLDMARADHWLVRTKPTKTSPGKEGSSILKKTISPFQNLWVFG